MARKTSHGGSVRELLLAAVVLLAAAMARLDGVHATAYTVGGAAGWSPGTDLKAWAAEYTFYVGDTLYFRYSYGQSSVLLVTKEAYGDCASDNPVANDGGEGDMTMELVSAQTYYFISGYSDQCSQGLHMAITVLAAPASSADDDNNNNNNNNNNNLPNSNNNIANGNGNNNNNNNHNIPSSNGNSNGNNIPNSNVNNIPTSNVNNIPNSNVNSNSNNNNIPNSPVIFLPPPHSTTYLPNHAHAPSKPSALVAPLLALAAVYTLYTFAA